MVRRGLHDRYIAKQLRQLIDVDLCAISVQVIGHVERKDDRDIQFKDLNSEIQIAFEIGRIHYVDDHIGTFLDDVIARDDLFR